MMIRRAWMKSVVGLFGLPFVAKAGTVGASLPDGQPIPVKTYSSYLPLPGGGVTTIYREWEPGARARCKLCPECGGKDDSCLVTLCDFVAKEDCDLFSAVDWIAKYGKVNG